MQASAELSDGQRYYGTIYDRLVPNRSRKSRGIVPETLGEVYRLARMDMPKATLKELHDFMGKVHMEAITLDSEKMRLDYAARREARRKFEERRAARAQNDGGSGKKEPDGEDTGNGMIVDEEFDVSDGEWEREDQYMRHAEMAWDYEERHPESRVPFVDDIDSMWLSSAVHTFTRAADGPEAAEFVRDINRRVVRSAPRQNQSLR